MPFNAFLLGKSLKSLVLSPFRKLSNIALHNFLYSVSLSNIPPLNFHFLFCYPFKQVNQVTRCFFVIFIMSCQCCILPALFLHYVSQKSQLLLSDPKYTSTFCSTHDILSIPIQTPCFYSLKSPFYLGGNCSAFFTKWKVWYWIKFGQFQFHFH